VAFDARGRDFAGFEVRGVLPGAITARSTPDLAASLARITALETAGVATVQVLPLMFCRGPDDLEAFLDQALSGVKG